MSDKHGEIGITIIFLSIVVLVIILSFYLFGFFQPAHAKKPTSNITGFSGLNVTNGAANVSTFKFTLKNPQNTTATVSYVLLSISGKTYTNLLCNNYQIQPGTLDNCQVSVNLTSAEHISASLQIYFTLLSSNAVMLTSGTVNIIVQNGTVQMNNTNQNFTLLTTFSQTGLPSGTGWSVSYSNTVNYSTSSQISFSTSSGNKQFLIQSIKKNGCVYTPNPSLGTLSGGSQQTVIFASSCTTNFTESGLPQGDNWTVNYASSIRSSNTNAITFITIGSTFAFRINSVSSSNRSTGNCSFAYIPSPGSGNLVAGAAKSISFTNTSACASNFVESGLPVGLSWEVTYDGQFNSSNRTKITFMQPIGSYSFNVSTIAVQSGNCSDIYSPSPLSGALQSGSSKSIAFNSNLVCSQIPTEFIEYGLPSGTNWSVSYDGSKNSSLGDKIYVTALPGTYSFNVGSLNFNGCFYSPSVSSGTLVAGSSKQITYSGLCNTSFLQSSLPPAYNWSVTYNSTTRYSVRSRINFTISAGNYSYSIPTLSNYTNNPQCTNYYWPASLSGYETAGNIKNLVFTRNSSCYTTFFGVFNGGTYILKHYNITYDGITYPVGGGNIPPPGQGGTVFDTAEGLYSYSVTNAYPVNYPSQNCNSTLSPSPSSGTAQAGTAIDFNFVYSSTRCDTIFVSPTPSLYSGSWWADYNGINTTGAIGSNITIYTSNNTYLFSGAMIKTVKQACFGGRCSYTLLNNCQMTSGSAQAGSVVYGGGILLSSYNWNCLNEFDEIGLPSGYNWGMTYGDTQTTTSNILNFPSRYTIGVGALPPLINESFSVPTFSNSTSYPYKTCTTAYTPSVPTYPSGYIVTGDDGPSATKYATDISYGGSTSCVQNANFTTTLPSGAAWYVRYNGVNRSSTSGVISFSESTAGTYPFKIFDFCLTKLTNQIAVYYLYTPTPISGNLNTGSSQSITFSSSQISSCNGYPS